MIKQSKQYGFTLIELMVVVALMGIIVSLANATMGRTSHRAAIKSLSEDITGLTTQTRIVAMTSGTVTSLCPVADITAAAPACSSWTTLTAQGANNSIGWVIFKDYNDDGIINGNDNIINTQAFNDYGGKVGVSADTGTTNHISYSRKGSLATSGRTLTVTSRVPQYSGAGFTRNIIIAAVTGRVRNNLQKKQ